MLQNIEASGKSIIPTVLLIGSCLFTTIQFGSLKDAWGAGEPMNSFEWDIQSVDAPKLFSYMGNPSLRLDGANHPHLAYGGDHLYYAAHDGTKWNIETVDRSEGVGLYASLALDAQGNPHISYYDDMNRHLKYARKTVIGWEIQTVDSAGSIGTYTSIAVDPDGNPKIAYSTWLNFAVKYASWTGSNWDIETVENGESPAMYLSLALCKDGNPHITYLSNSLKYATWTGISWRIDTIAESSYLYSTSLVLDKDDNPHVSYGVYNALYYAVWIGDKWSIQQVDYGGFTFGQYNSIALDADGNPNISYSDRENETLKFARWSGTEWIIEIVDATPHKFYSYTFICMSLVLDSTNKPHIGYWGFHDGTMRYAERLETGWNICVVDKSGRAGRYPSLALDGFNNPHISYLDETYGVLKYAHWNGNAWDRQVVDQGSFTGFFSSIALDSHGYPHITYFDFTYGVLRYAQWTGSDWETQTVDGPGAISYYAVGWYPSLALDRDNNPHISYFDENGTSVKYAHWTGVGWDILVVDETGALYTKNTSLAIDSKNFPHIIYEDDPWIKYARWTGTNWDIQTVDRAQHGEWSKGLALDKADHAHISYCNYSPIVFPLELRYASWTESGWEIQVVDYDEDWYKGLGWYSSLSLDSKDSPHISYYDYTKGKLKYARWTGFAWDIQVVDNATNVGLYTSLALDSDDNPHIAYYDKYLGDLKYAFGRLVGPDISVFPVSINFGDVMVGENKDQTVTIQNDGVLDLILDSIEALVPQFTIAGGTCTDGMFLAPSMSCYFVIRFAPDVPGQFQSFINVLSNVSDANPFNINVKGTGMGFVLYTITSIPEGLQIKVDGNTYNSPFAANWLIGSTHSIEAISPQSGSPGIRYAFSSWSDHELQSHTITTSFSGATYTAYFITQYSLTCSIYPPGGGSLSLGSPTWWDSNRSAILFAYPSIHYHFTGWSGDFSGTAIPANILMDAPKNVVANFIGEPPERVSQPSMPSGSEIGYVDVSYTYSTGGSFSNLLHPVEYQFDWKGDGTDLSPWGSMTQSKTWTAVGLYNIRARSRCITDTSVISEWSCALTVNISDRILLQSPSVGTVFDSCSLITAHQPPFSWSPDGTFRGFSILFSLTASSFASPIMTANVSKSRNVWVPSTRLWKTLMLSSYGDGEIRNIYWKIIAVRPDKTTAESEVRSFRIGSPETIMINAPSNEAILLPATPPTFNFTCACNIEFRIEFSRTNDFNDPAMKAFAFKNKDPQVDTVLSRTLTTSQWTAVKKLVGTGTGYFRVKAWDGIRETVSEVRSFTVR